jgi:class 3 adenylate cyclase
MTIRQDLSTKVTEFAHEKWAEIPNAYVIPNTDDLTFGNSGERLNVTVLYADIHSSTPMVDALSDWLAAEYYKAFLHCASQIIKRNDGVIQAYDGDRVMAIYTGTEQADQAVLTALELNDAVLNIINPIFQNFYREDHRLLKHTVGIDTGQLLATKVGVRAVGELAWIGRAANYAAKLNSFEGLDANYQTRITTNTFTMLSSALKITAGASIWEGPYKNFELRRHYRTNYRKELP